MEIIIGSSPQIGQSFPSNQAGGSSNGLIEVKLLNTRRPRQGIAGPPGAAREKNQ